MIGGHAIASSIERAVARGGPALVGYMTAGFPRKESFQHDLDALARECDVIEVGVPFSDPMADGSTIQRASFAALSNGVNLPWILQELLGRERRSVPVLLMSYLNPLLAQGLSRLPKAARAAGVAGFIVPDLPFEESHDLRDALESEDLALVQMVTPVTPDARLKMLCESARGFIYAVTMTGTTGKSAVIPDHVLAYMDRVREYAKVPVCAGFGIRSKEQVSRFAPHVDGVVVGSALVEALERGEDVGPFLRSLR